MKPGRELDALIAEKVMGWKRVVQPHPELAPVSLKDLYKSPDIPMPKYSTDIAAAWEVVEKLRLTSKVTVTSDKYSSFWICTNMHEDYWSGPGDETRYKGMVAGAFMEFGDTAPHAICLAALKAVGVPVSE